jgi:hypothetical protein
MAVFAFTSCNNPSSPDGLPSGTDPGGPGGNPTTSIALTAAVGNGELHLKWAALSGVADLGSYVVSVKTGGADVTLGEDKLALLDLDGDIRADITGLVKGAAYTIKIEAKDGETVLASVENDYTLNQFSEWDLAAIGKDDDHLLSGTYTLTRDLDLSWLVYEEDDNEKAHYKGNPIEWVPIGALTVVRGDWFVAEANDTIYAAAAGSDADDFIFTGDFDGNGKTIRNLILPTGDVKCVGLFGQTKGGEIKGLTITLPSAGVELDLDRKQITSGNSYMIKESNQYVGVLAGYANNTKITNVKINGGPLKITKEKDSANSNNILYAGGLLGAGGSGTEIKYCESAIDIEVEGILDYNKAVYIGGLAGYLDRKLSATEQYVAIDSSSARGNILVTAPQAYVVVGGLAGFVHGSTTGGAVFTLGSVKNSHAAVNVTVRKCKQITCVFTIYMIPCIYEYIG